LVRSAGRCGIARAKKGKKKFDRKMANREMPHLLERGVGRCGISQGDAASDQEKWRLLREMLLPVDPGLKKGKKLDREMAIREMPHL
jgi:hypothetical protein